MPPLNLKQKIENADLHLAWLLYNHIRVIFINMAKTASLQMLHNLSFRTVLTYVVHVE
jgi:hypothetical protein